MCLDLDADQNQEEHKNILFGRSEEIVVYKLYDKSTHNGKVRLDSPYRNKPLKLKDGYAVSNRRRASLTRLEKDQGAVYRGIHVYITRKAAYRQRSLGYLVIKCKVHKNDFVASDFDVGRKGRAFF